MKIKKILVGFMAAITAAAVVSAPISDNFARSLSGSVAYAADSAAPDSRTAEEKKSTGVITIRHPQTGCTYTAYQLFDGNVTNEQRSDVSDVSDTNPYVLKINGVKWGGDMRLNTTYDNSTGWSSDMTDATGKTYFFTWLKDQNKKVLIGSENKSILDIIKEYIPNGNNPFGVALTNITANTVNFPLDLAKALNLTNGNGANNKIKDPRIYDAFAEAATYFLKDGAAGTTFVEGTKTFADKSETVMQAVVKPGYYVIKCQKTTPESVGNPKETEKALYYSLVLVGATDLGTAEDNTALTGDATVNSKSGNSAATVKVKFYDKPYSDTNGRIIAKSDNTDAILPSGGNFPTTDGEWKTNVSMPDLSYVNCRIEITLPETYECFDQYYLAVPVMYQYVDTYNNNKNNSLQASNHFKRVGDPELKIIKSDGNSTVVTKYGETTNDSDIKGKIEGNTYTYANTGNSDVQNFYADEVFVINDLRKLINKDTIGENDQLVIEFPVKFDLMLHKTANGITTMGGYDQNDNNASGSRDNVAYLRDNNLLQNYISARAVYSSNPNKGVTGYDDTNKVTKFTYDTSKAPNSLENPIAVSMRSAANIVTYRLHLRVEQNADTAAEKGVSGLNFAIYDKTTAKYAVVEKINTNVIEDKDLEGLIYFSGTGNKKQTDAWRITGWETISDLKADGAVDDNKVTTKKADAALQLADTNGSLEIVGLAPGNYTFVSLDDAKGKFMKTGGNYVDVMRPTNYDEFTVEIEDEVMTKVDSAETEVPFLNPTSDLSLPAIKPVNSLSGKVFYKNSTTADLSVVDTTGGITGDAIGTKDPSGDDFKTAVETLYANKDQALVSVKITYIKPGVRLPKTGGIGTVIFFAAGGAIVLAATVLIVTRIRVRKEMS